VIGVILMAIHDRNRRRRRAAGGAE